MSQPASRRWDPETMLVVWLAACVSVFSFLFYLRHGEILLYGDAVAHINIARRVFDSRTPGLLQLGTVWLPLPHLLMIPFLLSDSLWRTGAGGSIPSLIAYVLGAVGIFRLVREALSRDDEPSVAARVAAWTAAVIFAANPNLIYVQTTALTESLNLGLFVWAVVYFSEFLSAAKTSPDDARSSLMKCGWCVAAACLTRYDAWILAAVMSLTALAPLKNKWNDLSLRRTIATFTLLAAASPVLWLAYNAIVYKNPLEFANGPYSAKAIEQRTTPPGAPPHPGTRNLYVAGTYFLKAGELTVANGVWGRIWVLLVLAGAIGSVISVSPLSDAAAKGTTDSRPFWPLFLLWTPVPFYMLSIAYGGVPIFLPVWWPHSLYNARYGLELLPAFAVFATLGAYFAASFLVNINCKIAVAGGMLVVTVVSYGFVWRAQPVCFREGWNNSRSRIALEHELVNVLEELPHDATFLMYLGDQVGALQHAGIPFRRVIYEGNHRTWVRPSDPDGLWERALADPGKYVQFVVALDNDPVSLAVPRQQLVPLAVIHVSGQPKAVVYQTAASIH